MQDLISLELREKFFVKVFKALQKEASKRRVVLTREWTRTFPKTAGVYCFFENNRLIYVGETGNISARMGDMLNTKNHTLRRLIGEAKFSKHKGYKKANSKESFIPGIEKNLIDGSKLI
jgi:hypothetical protein